VTSDYSLRRQRSHARVTRQSDIEHPATAPSRRRRQIPPHCKLSRIRHKSHGFLASRSRWMRVPILREVGVRAAGRCVRQGVSDRGRRRGYHRADSVGLGIGRPSGAAPVAGQSRVTPFTGRVRHACPADRTAAAVPGAVVLEVLEEPAVAVGAQPGR
jgi:hypothetical protein